MVKVAHASNVPYGDRMTDLLAGHGVVPQWTMADRLRKAREHSGLSQTELAEATGISRHSISNYERGAFEPRRPQLLVLALATGVDLEWLGGGSEPIGYGPLAPNVTWVLAA